MASIVARRRSDGTIAYTAQIRIKRDGIVVHTESNTFERKKAAEAWAQRREAELKSDPATLRRAQHKGVTIGQLIARYVNDRTAVAPFGRTKRSALDQLMNQPLAKKDALLLEKPDVVGHLTERRRAGVGASTALNDLIWLRIVFRFARSAWGIPVDLQMLDEVADLCRSERIIARPARRNRRPTAEELLRIEDWFNRPSRRGTIPMALILWFAIYSTRRLGEICELRMADYDRAHQVWLVRDVKHPDGAAGNHREMHVPDRLLPLIDAAIKMIPREDGDDRLFPYKANTVGAAWERAMKVLGIEDLHFHDLRHEGCSRLAEDGLGIPSIQQVSLHESWGSLQIYVNLRPRRDMRAEWSPPC